MSDRETVTERLTNIEKKIRNNIAKTQGGDLIKPSSFIETSVIEGIEEEVKVPNELRNSGIQDQFAYLVDEIGQ
jgi:hypothetical protein